MGDRRHPDSRVRVTPAPVEIVGITQGEMSRTVYFNRPDLAKIVGLEATAV